MSVQHEAAVGQSAANVGKGGVPSFFMNVLNAIMLILMAVGLVTLTLSWRTSDVEFSNTGELSVTQSTWWGFEKEVTQYIHAPEGWVIKRANGDYSPLKNQSVRLRN